MADLDFAALIGGPLIAVVNAQTASALTTVEFIKSVGFRPPVNNTTSSSSSKSKTTTDPQQTDLGVPVEVSFTYSRTLPNGQRQPVSITVPFLTMVPIPTLRIEEAYVEFNAKINSTATRDNTLTSSFNASATSLNSTGDTNNTEKPYATISTLTATVSNQKTDKSGFRQEREFSLKIKVKAVQDELPAGLDRILSLLENAIHEGPPALPNLSGSAPATAAK